MKVCSSNEIFKSHAHLTRRSMVNSPCTLNTFANKTPHIVLTQETMENIDRSGTITPTETSKAIEETIFDQLVDSTDTNHEVLAESETVHAYVTIVHDPQVVSLWDRRPRWSNEYPSTNPSLRNMSCTGFDSSQHTFADRKYTPSFEQTNTSLMNRNFHTH